MNIMQNFVPNKTFSSDDIDPTWANKEIWTEKPVLKTIHSKH